MSELSKKINSFYKTATKSEISKINNEINFSEHLYLVYTMFYIQHKDIDFISYSTGYSRGKIEADLRLIRKQLNKLL